MTVTLDSGAAVTFPLNDPIELIAGKLKALVERVAVRDLYDVSSIAATHPQPAGPDDQRLARRIILYYLAKSAPSPRRFDVINRFRGRDKDVLDALHLLTPTGQPWTT